MISETRSHPWLYRRSASCSVSTSGTTAAPTPPTSTMWRIGSRWRANTSLPAPPFSSTPSRRPTSPPLGSRHQAYLIDETVPELKQRRIEAHEITHLVIPWHHEFLFGDTEYTLDPVCHAIVEAEANSSGSLRPFAQEARDLKPNFKSIKSLAARYGNTITSALWRIVEDREPNRPVCGMVTIHPRYPEIGATESGQRLAISLVPRVAISLAPLRSASSFPTSLPVVPLQCSQDMPPGTIVLRLLKPIIVFRTLMASPGCFTSRTSQTPMLFLTYESLTGKKSAAVFRQ